MSFQPAKDTSADDGSKRIFCQERNRLGTNVDQDLSMIFSPFSGLGKFDFDECQENTPRQPSPVPSSFNVVGSTTFGIQTEKLQEVVDDIFRPSSLGSSSSGDSFPFSFPEHDLRAVTNDSDEDETVAPASIRSQPFPLDVHSRSMSHFGGQSLCQVGSMSAPTLVDAVRSNPTSPQGRVVVQTAYGPALLLPRHGRPNMDLSSVQATNQSGIDLLPVQRMQQLVPVQQGNNRKFQRWSDEEDDLLKEAIAACSRGTPTNWKKISTIFFAGRRTAVQCKSRWQKALQPGVLRGDWQKDEDLKIVRLRSQGLKWSNIAKHLPGRVSEHIRDRYVNFLDPTLKKTPWTKEEDEMLIQQQRLVGNKWTEISKVMHGRSENAIKNRWHNAKQTRLRRLRRDSIERARLEEVENLVPDSIPSSGDSYDEQSDAS